MRKIFKYQLCVDDYQFIDMPSDAEILHVGVQENVICVWALVDPSAPLVSRRFVIVGTGEPTIEIKERHIGTVLMPPYVWHIFTD